MNRQVVTTKTKRRIIIAKIVVNKLERFKPIEINLPSNVVKITGILVTTSKL
jgi:hypothetical protein